MELTDKLGTATYTPSVVGGAGGSSTIGGLAEVGANFLDAFSQRQRQQASAARETNNPALDEMASGAFTILSDGQGPNPVAAKYLKQAEIFQKGRDNGNVSNTRYDLAMNAMVNDIMSRYPDQAEEILAFGATQGIDHYYFREAQLRRKVDDNAIDQVTQANNSAFQYAAERGAFNPLTMSYGEGAARGYELKAQENERLMKKEQVEALIRTGEVTKPWWEAKFLEASDALVRSTKDAVFTTVDIGMQQVYDIIEGAGDDKEKLQLVDGALDSALMDLNRLDGDIRRALNSAGGTTITDPETGESRIAPIPKQAYEDAAAEIAAQKEIVTWLRQRPLEERKRYIEMTTLNAKVKANEYIPTVIEMSKALDMSIPQILQTLMINPNMFNLGTQEAQYVFDEMASGARKYSNQSLQYALEMTNKGQSPAFSTNPDQAMAGFFHNLNTGGLLGKSLISGEFTDGKDLNSTLEGFANNWSSIISFARTKYNAGNINATTANNALTMIFNSNSLSMIEAFQKKGGDPQVAQLMGAQSAIAAGTFIEALGAQTGQNGQKLVNYNQLTGKYIPVATIATPATSNLMRQEGSYLMKDRPDPQAVANANALNQLLDYVESVHTKFPVLKDEYLKAGNTSVRDVAAMQGFDKYAQQVQNQINEEQAIKRAQDNKFQQGAQSFDFYKDGSFAIDNSGFGDGGNRPSASGEFGLKPSVPEEYVKLVDSSAAAEGLDPGLLAAMLSHESAWNPNARGPKIAKYAGTEDEQALGIAQFLPSTARDMGVKDPMDPKQAIPGAAKYLGLQMKTFNNDPVLALMAYNWGPDNVSGWLKSGKQASRVPKQTIDYIKQILGVDLVKMLSNG